jgi:hypothetical protein
MKSCSYCGNANDDNAIQCRRCDAYFVKPVVYSVRPLAPKGYWMGPEVGRSIRNKALAAIVLGLMIRVYWGGHGPWPVIDYAPWAGLRPWLERFLLAAGCAGYITGWVLNFI